MTPGVGALLLLAGLAAPDALAAAWTAFAHGDYALAEELAQAAAQPPDEGRALQLVGLARFRAGRAAEALEALEAAGRAPAPPPVPLWQYNRGACLYALGRNAEAEAAFLEAAREPALAGLALVDAGFAALDGGDPVRAAELAARARAEGTEAVAPLVADLEAQLGGGTAAAAADGEDLRRSAAEHTEGLADYDAGRFEQARRHFRRAAALDPTAAQSRIMSGAAALRLDACGEARDDLERALALPLPPADAGVARAYLDELARRRGASCQGWNLMARLGGGYDDDVVGASSVGPEERGEETGSAKSSGVALGGLGVARRWRLSERASAELGYGLDQVSYLSSAAADLSSQAHALSLGLELHPGGSFRMGITLGSQLDFAGRARYRPLQAGGSAGAWVTRDEGSAASSRLEVGWAHKVGLRREFDYLTGDRLEASATQQLRLGRAVADLAYRHREERIGTLERTTQLALPAADACPPGCVQSYAIPLGYAADTVDLSVRTGIGARLQLGLTGGVELRRYRGESYLALETDGSSAVVDRRRRRDRRLFAGLEATLRLWGPHQLALHYELSVNRSNVARDGSDPSAGGCAAPGHVCHALDYGDRNYRRQAVALETIFRW